MNDSTKIIIFFLIVFVVWIAWQTFTTEPISDEAAIYSAEQQSSEPVSYGHPLNY